MGLAAENFAVIDHQVYVDGRVLYESGVMTKDNYFKMQQRNIIKMRTRGGNGRRALVEYRSIPAKYREMVRIAAGFEPSELVVKSALLGYVEELPDVWEQLNGWMFDGGHGSATLTGRDKTLTGREGEEWEMQGLPKERVSEYYTNAKLIVAVKIFVERYRVKMGRGYDVWGKAVEELESSVVMKLGHTLPSHPRRLKDKVDKYFKEGIRSLIHKNYKNANAAKIGPQEHDVLMVLAADRRKFSFEDIGALYNDRARQAGLKILTVSAIEKHLNEPEHHRVWFYQRHGKDVANKQLQSLIKRKSVSTPNYLWSLDGTALQLYYVDEQGKLRSDLYMNIVIDVCSRAVVGHSICYSENTESVIRCLQNAVFTTKNAPCQMQYDNSSAIVNSAVKTVIGNMSKVSFPCQPRRARAKYVEEIIGHIQSTVLRYCSNFKGLNVTATSDNSRANSDYLIEQRRNRQFPTLEEVVLQFESAIKIWNEMGTERKATGERTGESRMAIYKKDYEGRKTLNGFELYELFYMPLGKYKYSNGGIHFTLNKKDYDYIVVDKDGIGDFAFQQMHLNKEFEVRVNVHNMSAIRLHDAKTGERIATAIDKPTYSACVADRVAGEDAAIRTWVKKQEEFGWKQSVEELRKSKERIAEVQELRPTADGFGWADLSKALWNVEQRNEEDKLNTIDDLRFTNDIHSAEIASGGALAMTKGCGTVIMEPNRGEFEEGEDISATLNVREEGLVERLLRIGR